MFPTTQNSFTDLSQALQESKINTTVVGISGKAFMKFDYKTGDYTFGRDHEEITDEEIVINTYSFIHGWVLWVNGKPTKINAPFTKELPPPPEPVAGNEAAESRGFEARFIDDDETILVFEISSYGGRKGCDDLLNQIKARAGQGETRFLFPKVRLTSESYKAQQGGTIHNPVFEVVEWLDQEGNSQKDEKQLPPAAEETQEAETEEAPPRRRRRKS